MTTHAPSVLARTAIAPAVLIALLCAITVATWAFGSGTLQRTVVEMLIRVVLVVGMWIFVGNSGIMSFGHIGFMCLGAYAAAWFTIPPMLKEISLSGLPTFVRSSQFPFWASAIAASLLPAVFAAIIGPILMRLAGIAASIATFAMLAVINTVYSNWSTVTGGTSSIIGIPLRTNLWLALAAAAAAILIAWAYAISRSGLALRAARDEAIAAQASGVHIERERTIAFVLSAFVCGAAGVLYAHFLGIVTPDAFFLTATFVALSMLVVGGMNSLSGAVLGVVLISTIIQALRSLEKGFAVGDVTVAIPSGSQEIAIGVVMIVILIFRPTGLMGNREIVLPRGAR
ncbi:branched-chain amino acid ABC transporter permease [Amaricoccus sp.]|uniref:branched-chain amino acid ABC transporter permease n=1 Tax=Amaricoccus sp. TaxID=1872485 RepID=UPI001B680AD5|nr:branched-chain amino acid ABC transporter permease [Amaricoccus sp.]MBP7000983.1 branched-chain amino acid ABC transporter permease [Amaricoccus sp.]